MTITEACVKVRDDMLAEMRARWYRNNKKWIRFAPWTINTGQCSEFTERVCRLVKGATAFSLWKKGDYNYHSVVKFRGRYYDAECVEGGGWKSLPICKTLPWFLKFTLSKTSALL